MLKKVKLFSILLLVLMVSMLYAGKQRGIYVWEGYDVVRNTNNTTRYSMTNWVDFLGFCAAPHQETNKKITSVYLSVFEGGGYSLFTPVANKTKLRWFIRDLHSRDMRVEALMGDPSWATSGGKTSGLNTVQQVIDYNISVTPNERFDGLIMDIEPDVGTAAGWTGYTNFLGGVKQKFVAYNATNNPDMGWGDSIRCYYDTDGYGYTLYQDILDRCSFVSMMSYSETYAGIRDFIANEISYGDSIGCETRFGVETGNFTPETITFFQESKTNMESQINLVENYFNSSTSLHEVFIHAFKTYAPEVGAVGIASNMPTTTAPTYATNRAPYVRVQKPNGGEVWSGSNWIKWFYADRENNVATNQIQLSINGGGTWVIITNLPSTVKSNRLNTHKYANSANALIRIISKQSTPVILKSFDRSDAVFSIANSGEVLSIMKNIDIPSNAFLAGSDNNAVMALNINSGTSNRKLRSFQLFNNGSLPNTMINAVKVWWDKGSSGNTWDSDDQLVDTLAWNTDHWENLAISFTNSLKNGLNFIVTIDISAMAGNDTFKARIPVNGVGTSNLIYGPSSELLNASFQVVKQTYLFIDDFSAQAQYGSSQNDFAIGGEANEYTDDDATMRSVEFVSNESWIWLPWQSDGSSYWYSVLDDDDATTDGIIGFPATNYMGVSYEYLVLRLRGAANSVGSNIGIVFRDYANVWKRKMLKDYLPMGLTSAFTTVEMPLNDWRSLGVNTGAIKSMSFDMLPHNLGGMLVDHIYLKAKIPTPLDVSKNFTYSDGPVYRILPGLTNQNVLSFNILSGTSGDKVRSVKIRNNGTLPVADLNTVKLWFDSDANGILNTLDTYLTNLPWNGSLGMFSNNIRFASNISGSGRSFIVTIDLKSTATFYSTADFAIPVGGVSTWSNLQGPTAAVGNGVIHVFYNNGFVDDFSLQSQYGIQCNDRGFSTDDDGTMIGGDYVTNDSFLLLKWAAAGNYWYSVINDVTGFNASVYSNFSFKVKVNTNTAAFLVTFRDINNNWEQRSVTNYLLSKRVTTNWQTAAVDFRDGKIWANLGIVDYSKIKSVTIQDFSRDTGILFVDDLMFVGSFIPSPLTVTKYVTYSDAPVNRLLQGLTNQKVLGVNIVSGTVGDKIRDIKIRNNGTLPANDIDKVKLWLDSDSNGILNTSDLYLTNLPWNAGISMFSNNVRLASNISGTGRSFILTVDLKSNASFYSTADFAVNANGVETWSNNIGPTAAVANGNIHVFYQNHFIDDFSSQAQYGSQANDRGFTTDDDGTMAGGDYVTNESYLCLKWTAVDNYWYTVINDSTGFNASSYSNFIFDVKVNTNTAWFLVTFRDINGIFQQRSVTNYLPAKRVTTNWQTAVVKLKDSKVIYSNGSFDLAHIKTITIESFSRNTGVLFVDNLMFSLGTPFVGQAQIGMVNILSNATLNGVQTNSIPGATHNYIVIASNYGTAPATNVSIINSIDSNALYMTNIIDEGSSWVVEYSTNISPFLSYVGTLPANKNKIRHVRWVKSVMDVYPGERFRVRIKVSIK